MPEDIKAPEAKAPAAPAAPVNSTPEDAAVFSGPANATVVHDGETFTSDGKGDLLAKLKHALHLAPFGFSHKA
jgi:hypothetical protein